VPIQGHIITNTAFCSILYWRLVASANQKNGSSVILSVVATTVGQG
jgi:hypothetical protein